MTLMKVSHKQTNKTNLTLTLSGKNWHYLRMKSFFSVLLRTEDRGHTLSALKCHDPVKGVAHTTALQPGNPAGDPEWPSLLHKRRSKLQAGGPHLLRDAQRVPPPVGLPPAEPPLHLRPNPGPLRAGPGGARPGGPPPPLPPFPPRRGAALKWALSAEPLTVRHRIGWGVGFWVVMSGEDDDEGGMGQMWLF